MPICSAKWRDWARLFVRDYQHFFAASGEHPAFGRSITYRFNCLNVFGLGLAENCTDVAERTSRRSASSDRDSEASPPSAMNSDQSARMPRDR